MMRLILTAALLSLSGSAWAQSATSSTAKRVSSLGDHQSLLTSFHERIDALDERITSSERLLKTLKESALGGVIARTRAVIVHKNAMGESFELERAVYTLDGGVIFSKENTDGSLQDARSFELYNGPINPGAHQIVVSLLYRGKSSGVFTYLDGYKFKIDSKYKLDVPEGKSTRLEIVSYQRDDISLETSERLAVRYDVEIGTGVADKADEAQTTPAIPSDIDDSRDGDDAAN